MMTANETAQVMIERLLAAVDARSGDRVLVVLNGSGATTLMEMFIVYRAVHKILRERGIEPVFPRIGEYLTVQEMAGFQMFVAKMDDELIRLWKAPCDTPYLTVRYANPWPILTSIDLANILRSGAARQGEP